MLEMRLPVLPRETGGIKYRGNYCPRTGTGIYWVFCLKSINKEATSLRTAQLLPTHLPWDPLIEAQPRCLESLEQKSPPKDRAF